MAAKAHSFIRIGSAIIRPESVDAFSPVNVGASKTRVLCHGVEIVVHGSLVDVARALGFAVVDREVQAGTPPG